MEHVDLLAFVSTEMNSTTVTLALLVVFLVLLYWYSTSAFSKLSKVGIRHPPPLPFIGNLLFFREGFWENHTKLIREYGPVCGHSDSTISTKLPPNAPFEVHLGAGSCPTEFFAGQNNMRSHPLQHLLV